ncbi:DUF928 domain-containing protein [Nostoc sp. TCL26-01]|uniref:DUF928 domain-containing protein n=1 Tax=Nostoc sp. TCL26-01 TaxID=2576904 RepID=UPI0015BC1B4B|nr:DUF928 domain-containing protein [Nostoc sp. TCL26-01]QLE57339.1 DUF928 domain-containing protein [Nostoc sp. TCL26-01]
MKNQFKHLYYWLFLFSFLLKLFLLEIPLATAGFKPRNPKPASDYSRTGGRRGCPSDKIPLTLLAPKTYIGYTSASHPTLIAFVSASHKIRWRIFEFNTKNIPQELGSPVEQNVSPGVFQLSWTKNQPELKAGKKYLWQVAIIDCVNSSSSKLVERAEFMVIEMPSVLKDKLLTTVSHQQQADIYAESDLWYEALATALKSAKSGQLGDVGLSLIQDLMKSELPKKEEETQQIQHLQKIINLGN